MDQNAIAAGLGSSLIFVTLNVTMNLYMKWLFAPDGGDFAFPWTMLAVQQLEAYMVLQPWIALKSPAKRCGWDIGEDEDDVALGWTVALQVLAVTVLFCLNVGLNSLSLVRISITLNQTVRAFLPVGVLVLASFLEQRTYPKHSYITTGVLILGIGLTCCGSPNFQFDGFCLALASTVIAALGSSLNGRLLNTGPFSKGGSEKIARLMMFQSVPAFFIFSVVAVVTEGSECWAKVQAPGSWQLHQRFALVSISSALALMSNLGRCFLVAATSALMETLAGNAKVAALCIIDNQLFHTALRPYNYAGIAITFTGFSVHVLLQYASRPSERDREDRPEQLALNAKDERFAKDERLTIQNRGNGHSHGLKGPETTSLTINLPRMISGSDTGLASEHLAVRMGKPAPKNRRRRVQDEDQANVAHRRQRASTWQAGVDPTQTWLDRVGANVGMDLAPVIEPPPWLSNEELAESPTANMTGAVELGWLSPIDETSSQWIAPRLPTSRSRIWSDMTHCAVGNPRPVAA